MMKSVVSFVLMLVLLGCAYPQVAQAAIVKKSTSGICHDQNSAYYSRTKNYQPFPTLAACVNSGGRLPKSAARNIDKATEEALREGRGFVSLYERNDWKHWIDEDRDCQNTRHEMLIKASSIPVSFKTSKQCNVIRGRWYDPYSGQTFTNSNDLDLDHLVPLKFAHGHGGDVWSRDRKTAFANDEANLILVSASLNRSKGSKGADEWLPPNHAYRCTYIRKFNGVMKKYGLAYIPSEKRIIDRMLKACGK
jgi:hypothetical protein